MLAPGCFDLLHPGHIRLLEQARSLGDVVVVALESDASVRAREAARQSGRGPKRVPLRPITPANERAEILAALASVDYVVEIDESSLAQFIERLTPEIVVIGAGPGGAAAEEEAAPGVAAKIVCIPLEPGYSTTSLVARIQQLRA